MKILYTFLLIILASIGFGQRISPYYPAIENQNNTTTQFTYYEFNFVSLKLQDYLSNKYSLIDTDLINEENYQIFVLTFNESISINKNPSQLKFYFKTFTIGENQVIKDVKITGSKESLLIFFAFYWSSPIDTDINKSNILGQNNFRQDKITFEKMNNSYIIRIINNTITNDSEFTNNYLSKVREVTETRNTKQENNFIHTQQTSSKLNLQSIRYWAKKKGNKIETQLMGSFPNRYDDEVIVNDKIKTYLKNKENGEYVLSFNYQLKGKEVKEFEIKTEQHK
ncbi:hypothetical protein ACTS95_08100 [Empedobacter brevis]